jgi:hypothetical protein
MSDIFLSNNRDATSPHDRIPTALLRFGDSLDLSQSADSDGTIAGATLNAMQITDC